MNKHLHLKLTSAEIGSLWTTYMTESSVIPVLSYFQQTVEDSEIKDIVSKTLTKSKEHVKTLTELFKLEKHPVPQGFSMEDVNLAAPRLFSDTYMLIFIRNLGKAGIAAHGMALSMSARKDVRDLFFLYLKEAADIEDQAKEVMLSKGVFIRPPYIDSPSEVTFVEKQSFLRGWLGERRTLTGAEIAHIFLNYSNNTGGKALLLGFAQTAQSEELRNHFIRGIDIARTIITKLRTLLEESTLSAPMTWDTEITNSTVAPFSDKLMLFHVSSLNAIGIGNIGGSLALSLRKDIAAKYFIILKEIGLYAEDSANLLIKNGWFERPPQAIDREQLSKGKKGSEED
ncbi:DUF3231 family protein [Metabacillus sp. HB246100]|uniref:DUF3231 family protein n=1 Tax=Bacillus weihaiensis TaxID=1547283 RepID=UPI00235796D6|nr:DUF3231 family protein [Bacillus weihaiensis]